jgi:hypothetical protein
MFGGSVVLFVAIASRFREGIVSKDSGETLSGEDRQFTKARMKQIARDKSAWRETEQLPPGRSASSFSLLDCP